MRLIAPACMMLMATLLQGAEPGTRQLSFEQRVQAQAAIERVYYAHQVGATRPFEEAVPFSVLERKVRTYLKQSIVLDAIRIRRRPVVGDRLDALGHVLDRVEPRASADSVDRLEATRGNEPRARIRRNTFARPMFERGAKGIVQRFLRDVETPEQPDQGREDAARFAAIDRLDLCGNLFGR